MKKDPKKKKKYGVCSMVKNDGIIWIFGRIGLWKFIGFSNRFGQRKKIVGGSDVENYGKNN